MASADINMVRVLDAPRSAVWAALTEPERIARWFGPHAYTVPVARFEARVGAPLHIEMRGPEGLIVNEGEVLEVIEGERLVYSTRAFIDADGVPGIEGGVDLTLEDDGAGGTRLTVHSFLSRIGPGHEGSGTGMEEGWRQSLERLDEELHGPTLKMRHDETS